MKKTQFITVENTCFRVDSWGDVTPNDIQSDPERKPDELILVIPGNPGVLEFYEEFLSHLYKRTNKCIWILSHSGHDYKLYDGLKRNEKDNLYNLKDQIDIKKAFIENYLKDVKLYMIGHSIGCKMIMEIFKSSHDVKFEKCYFLFPCIERMADSRNAKIFIPVYKYFLKLLLLLCYIFCFLPFTLQEFGVKIHFWLTGIPFNNISSNSIYGVINLLHPPVVEQSLFLANDELIHVRELDNESILKLGKIVKLYYGRQDGWVPVCAYDDLKKNFKDIDAELCSRGFQHAFVLKDSLPMADLVSDWIISK